MAYWLCIGIDEPPEALADIKRISESHLVLQKSRDLAAYFVFESNRALDLHLFNDVAEIERGPHPRR